MKKEEIESKHAFIIERGCYDYREINNLRVGRFKLAKKSTKITLEAIVEVLIELRSSNYDSYTRENKLKELQKQIEEL